MASQEFIDVVNSFISTLDENVRAQFTTAFIAGLNDLLIQLNSGKTTFDSDQALETGLRVTGLSVDERYSPQVVQSM